MLLNIKAHIAEIIIEQKRRAYIAGLRERLDNKDFSLITNNCIGGVISHNLGLQFRSPTINLYIRGAEYLALVKDLKYYLSCEMIQDNQDVCFPVGLIVPKDDEHIPIRIWFQHYKSYEEAKSKWEERSKRINYDNLYYIWEFYDNLYDCNLICEFDSLPIKKMCLLHKDIPGIENKYVFDCGGEVWEEGKLFQNDGFSGKNTWIDLIM